MLDYASVCDTSIPFQSPGLSPAALFLIQFRAPAPGKVGKYAQILAPCHPCGAP